MMPLLRHGELSRMRDAHRTGQPAAVMTIVVLPALDAIVVITRTSYNTRGMHQQTIKLIEDEILPSLACGA